jgi:hypothetical protein
MVLSNNKMKHLFITLLLLSVFITNAQDTLHGSHKGKVVISGNYRIEAFGCEEYVEVFIYDKFMEPLLNYGIIGDVKFFKQGDISTGAKLVYYSNDGFTAKLPEYDFQYFKVTVQIQGVPYSAKFRNDCVIRN